MAAGRDIPAALDRAVRVEAGHRCAIPTCRATSGLEVHHIVDWAIVKEHTFENLILLCAICHRRATIREIDRKSVLAYKANLSLLASRYGDLERRVLDHFVQHPEEAEIEIDKSHQVLLSYLVGDGMLQSLGYADGAVFLVRSDREFQYGPIRWALTDAGKELVDRLRQAREIE